jgi:hypothetical protein
LFSFGIVAPDSRHGYQETSDGDSQAGHPNHIRKLTAIHIPSHGKSPSLYWCYIGLDQSIPPTRGEGRATRDSLVVQHGVHWQQGISCARSQGTNLRYRHAEF